VVLLGGELGVSVQLTADGDDVVDERPYRRPGLRELHGASVAGSGDPD
jgi:hypothetical protein